MHAHRTKKLAYLRRHFDPRLEGRYFWFCIFSADFLCMRGLLLYVVTLIPRCHAHLRRDIPAIGKADHEEHYRNNQSFDDDVRVDSKTEPPTMDVANVKAKMTNVTGNHSSHRHRHRHRHVANTTNVTDMANVAHMKNVTNNVSSHKRRHRHRHNHTSVANTTNVTNMTNVTGTGAVSV